MGKYEDGDDPHDESPAAMARRIEGVRVRLYGAQVLAERAGSGLPWSEMQALMHGSVVEVNWAIDMLTIVRDRMTRGPG